MIRHNVNKSSPLEQLLTQISPTDHIPLTFGLTLSSHVYQGIPYAFFFFIFRSTDLHFIQKGLQHHGRLGSTSLSYSEGSVFKSRPVFGYSKRSFLQLLYANVPNGTVFLT